MKTLFNYETRIMLLLDIWDDLNFDTLHILMGKEYDTHTTWCVVRHMIKNNQLYINNNKEIMKVIE